MCRRTRLERTKPSRRDSKQVPYFWEDSPSFTPRLRLRICEGILNCIGLRTTVTIVFTSSVGSSPVRSLRSMSHFLQTMFEMLRPML